MDTSCCYVAHGRVMFLGRALMVGALPVTTGSATSCQSLPWLLKPTNILIPSSLIMSPNLLSLFLLLLTTSSNAAQVDLTAANRRPAIPGLPDWTKAGFAQGTKNLPADTQIGKTIGANVLAQHGVIPNDGVDDTEGLKTVLNTLGKPDETKFRRIH